MLLRSGMPGIFGIPKSNTHTHIHKCATASSSSREKRITCVLKETDITCIQCKLYIIVYVFIIVYVLIILVYLFIIVYVFVQKLGKKFLRKATLSQTGNVSGTSIFPYLCNAQFSLATTVHRLPVAIRFRIKKKKKTNQAYRDPEHHYHHRPLLQPTRHKQKHTTLQHTTGKSHWTVCLLHIINPMRRVWQTCIQSPHMSQGSVSSARYVQRTFGEERGKVPPQWVTHGEHTSCSVKMEIFSCGAFSLLIFTNRRFGGEKLLVIQLSNFHFYST